MNREDQKNLEKQIKGEKALIKLTRILLEIMFYIGIIVLLTLPYSLKLAGKYYSAEINRFYIPMLIIFFLAGAFGILIIWQLKKMMKTVIGQNCFVSANVISLKRMGTCSFSIAAAFLIKIIFIPTPATFVIILTFFIAGLFCFVLANVFREAVRYKEENELTI